MMKRAISVVLLVVFCSNAVLGDENDETQKDGASQSGRIINGIAVNIVNYKFALNMQYGYRFFCGASVISASHALTAAHCVYPIRNIPSRATLNGGNPSFSAGEYLFQVVRIVVHPSYNPNASPGTSDFDVSVLTVPTNAFRGRPNILPIALQISEMPVDTRCYVVGWGRTNINSPAPTSGLRYANMDIVSQGTCAAAWAPYRARSVTSNMICAKYSNGVDICKGDSGGAFVCAGRLNGIVSFINPTCNSAWPAGFAKVIAPSIRRFIRSQTAI
uniref:Peptidase S1 domain-containing protein n=1 Tax=Anopheles minimus TaxID=112268 RepID=A0A182W2G6_9DIPT